MINDEKAMNVQSTIQGDTARMGINEAAMGHIMSILTKQYADPELAVIREYSTNASDAQIEAGVQRPIEVTTPSALSPYLKIRDYGVGLSVEDIHEIYSQYGTSTKRGTNAQNGMLGIGCKSGLAYADQFTLVSIKDGVRVQVVVSRDEDGGGSMTVVDTARTTEDPGVTVVIPAKRDNALAAKAQEFFAFWPKGSVLLNGAEPERIDGLWLNDHYCVRTLDYHARGAESLIVMGGVAYPHEHDFGFDYARQLVVFVPIGSVNFAPSREALMDTPKTRRMLEHIEQELQRLAREQMQVNIDKAPDAPTALSLAEQAHATLGRITQQATYTWNGVQIPRQHDFADHPYSNGGIYPALSVAIVPRYNGRGTGDNIAFIRAEQWNQTLWILGHPSNKFSTRKRERMEAWMDQATRPASTKWMFLRADELPPEIAPWVDPARVFKWEDVLQVKLPTEAARGGSTGRIRGSFDVVLNGVCKEGYPAADIDTATALYYIHGNVYAAAIYKHVLPGATIVAVPGNRLDKFRRDFPRATEVGAGVKAAWEKWQKRLTADQRDSLALRTSRYGTVTLLKQLGDVNDPKVARLARLSKAMTDGALETRYNTFKSLGYRLPDLPGVLSAYPLLAAAHPKHNVIYVNAVYAAQQQKGASA